MKRAFAFIVVFVFLGALAAGLSWFQFLFKPEMIKGFIKAAGQPVQAVAAATSDQQTWPPQLQAIGSFRAEQGVELSTQIGGAIRAIRFESAQDVTKGAVLVEIDDSVDQADLKSSLAALQNATVTFDRQNRLIEGGTTSRATLDQSIAARDQAAAAADRVRAIITQKAVAAPFSGRLGIRRVDVGQYISPGTPLVTLQQLDPIFVDFQLPEQNLATLAAGQTVDVSVDAYPARKFTGQVKFIDSRVSPDTRNILIRAEVKNSDKSLLPGMFANVVVNAGKPADVVTVPRTAVNYSLYGDSVLVLKPEPPPSGSAQAAPDPAAAKDASQIFIIDRRVVTVGDVRDNRVSILKGLSKGEQVVTEGQIKLAPGARAKIDSSASLPPMSPLPRP